MNTKLYNTILSMSLAAAVFVVVLISFTPAQAHAQMYYSTPNYYNTMPSYGYNHNYGYNYYRPPVYYYTYYPVYYYATPVMYYYPTYTSNMYGYNTGYNNYGSYSY